MSTDSIKDQVYALGAKARQAARALTLLTSEEKNAILLAMAHALRENEATILEANAQDISAGEERGLTSAMLDRLRLDHDRLEAMAAGIEHVVTLPDPLGEILDDRTRPNGIRIQQIRVPIGVIGIIYESRPNVTSDAAVLCLKSGNATILRGGSEAIHSNRAIAATLQQGGEKAGLPAGAIQLIPFTDRESVSVLAGMDQYLDLIIPRGGKGLIEAVVSQARMPVIKHYDGICHLYIHHDADPDMAVALTIDSKTQKPGVCNALETLLIHQDIAPTLLPALTTALREKGVTLRGCERTREILRGGDLRSPSQEKNTPSSTEIQPATPEDWDTEYLDLILAIKIVDDIDQAIDHINTHSSQHTEVIVTEDQQAARRFQTEIDSACLFHNLSSRFSDGGEFGFGAEIGISTDKLHARGPMGLRELTSYQYRATGHGQTKA